MLSPLRKGSPAAARLKASEVGPTNAISSGCAPMRLGRQLARLWMRASPPTEILVGLARIAGDNRSAHRPPGGGAGWPAEWARKMAARATGNSCRRNSSFDCSSSIVMFCHAVRFISRSGFYPNHSPSIEMKIERNNFPGNQQHHQIIHQLGRPFGDQRAFCGAFLLIMPVQPPSVSSNCPLISPVA